MGGELAAGLGQHVVEGLLDHALGPEQVTILIQNDTDHALLRVEDTVEPDHGQWQLPPPRRVGAHSTATCQATSNASWGGLAFAGVSGNLNYTIEGTNHVLFIRYDNPKHASVGPVPLPDTTIKPSNSGGAMLSPDALLYGFQASGDIGQGQQAVLNVVVSGGPKPHAEPALAHVNPPAHHDEPDHGQPHHDEPHHATSAHHRVGAGYLSIGSGGLEVSRWQQQLNVMMNAGLNVDGVFGHLTQLATMEFQRAHGLAADGIVGPHSEAVMTQLTSAQPQAPGDAQAPCHPSMQGPFHPDTHGPFDPQTHGHYHPETYGQDHPAVHGAYHPGLHGPFHPAMHGAYHPGLHGPFDPAIHGAFDVALHGEYDASLHGSAHLIIDVSHEDAPYEVYGVDLHAEYAEGAMN